MRVSVGLALAVVFLLAPSASAQQPMPRATDGRPDFEGVWESFWLTPLERPDSAPAVRLTEAQAETVRKAFLQREAARATSQLGTEGEIAIADKLLRIDGGYRGSQVVDPPDGRIPRTPSGAARRASIAEADGPENLSRGVRCLSGVGLPPMGIANFDNMHRIVQAPGNVVIYSESINDTRILPLAAGLAPNKPRSMAGASFAHWEGDTLVVETSRFDGHGPINAAPSNVPLSDDAVIVERFSLASPDELDIRYTVADPQNYTQPWSGEVAWLRSSQRMYETVCHEGNYSLANMLRAARVEEGRAARKGPQAPHR